MKICVRAERAYLYPYFPYIHEKQADAFFVFVLMQEYEFDV